MPRASRSHISSSEILSPSWTQICMQSAKSQSDKNPSSHSPSSDLLSYCPGWDGPFDCMTWRRSPNKVVKSTRSRSKPTSLQTALFAMMMQRYRCDGAARQGSDLAHCTRNECIEAIPSVKPKYTWNRRGLSEVLFSLECLLLDLDKAPCSRPRGIDADSNDNGIEWDSPAAWQGILSRLWSSPSDIINYHSASVDGGGGNLTGD